VELHLSLFTCRIFNIEWFNRYGSGKFPDLAFPQMPQVSFMHPQCALVKAIACAQSLPLRPTAYKLTPHGFQQCYEELYVFGRYRAGLTMVPNVPWHRAPRREGAPRQPGHVFYACPGCPSI